MNPQGQAPQQRLPGPFGGQGAQGVITDPRQRFQSQLAQALAGLQQRLGRQTTPQPIVPPTDQSFQENALAQAMQNQGQIRRDILNPSGQVTTVQNENLNFSPAQRTPGLSGGRGFSPLPGILGRLFGGGSRGGPSGRSVLNLPR